MSYLSRTIDVKRARIHSFYLLLLATLPISYGQSCQMEGVTFWPVPVSEEIWDWHRGEVTNRATTNIEGINSVSYGAGLNRGPYVDVSISNSRFIMTTNDQYPWYEEYEISDTMSLTVNFSCAGGTSINLVFIITVTDSNNNSPIFRPSDELEFTVMPPLPPGYIITSCLNNILVRDIDLTTIRIDFEIEENPYFEIAYDATTSTADKEFAGVLRTKTFIRSLPEPVVLTIYATDIDATKDPPLTNTTEIRIISDLEFQMPEEPVFTQTFYLATYTKDNQVTLQNPISLQQGYDELVTFNLEGAYTNYFDLTQNGNQLSLVVRTPLSSEIFIERQIYLIVTAEREYTSGSTATIIIEFPEDVSLDFERAHYTGSITDDNLILAPLILSQGYEGSEVSVLIFGEHSPYFNAVVQENVITLTMEPLNEHVISENNFIYLELVASNGRSYARSVITLEILKDDNITPIFNQAVYYGNYDPTTGLVADQILIVQGYDNTVRVNIQGDYVNYFQIIQDGPAIYLSVSALPLEIYNQGPIVLSIEATKPRTVGANAAIIITLPAARKLEFESATNRGTLQNDILTLGVITLISGYDDGISFELIGEYSAYFLVDNVLNEITISLSNPLPNSIIEDNNIIVLSLTASGINAVTATTSVILDIIKNDTITPVFNQNIYYGLYTGSSIDIEDINLAQGYDESVTFWIEGDHSQYFTINNSDNSVILSLQSPIPEDIIFKEKVLSFNILAEKQFTVGANAAILISFSSELTDTVIMKFSQNTYVGVLADNVLFLDDIVLNVGYASGTEFQLSGEYSQYFVLGDVNNVVSLTLTTLPSEIIENNKIIILEVEAQRERAVSVSTTVIIDIVKDDVIPLVFSQAYYRGVYTEQTSLIFNDKISLTDGYSDYVQFDLQGDYSSFFALIQSGNSLTVVNVSPLTQDILEYHNQLLLTVIASKPNTYTGRAVISIDLPKDQSTNRHLQFAQDFYTGIIKNNTFVLDDIYLDGYASDVTYNLMGDYTNYFQISNEAGIFTLTLEHNISEILENIIILTLEAIVEGQIRTHTTIIIEVIKEEHCETPMVFEKDYYIGSYSAIDGLNFNVDIRLTHGYHPDVLFTLSGDDSQWFELVQSEDSVTLILLSPIPPAVIASNQQLVFVVHAGRTGSTTARATIVITLGDEFTGDTILGFERINYQGTIENNEAILEPVTLIQGYSPDVMFSLRGGSELESYFTLSPVGATVTISLRTAIPEQSVPPNGVIILELQATAPQALTAYATVVFTIAAEKDAVEPVVDLVFANTYYTGSYTASGSLIFENPISLSQGYDDSVQFALEGEQSQWFGLVQTGNSVTLRLVTPIPPAVIASNQQLVFVVSAGRTGSTTARATIVITLGDEFTGDTILGFERITYQGTIENNEAILEPVTLIQGYSPDVMFSLRGELESYFTLSPVGATVTISLSTAIPEQSVPPNGVIVLELQATAPQALTAYATVVFTIAAEKDAVDPVVDLVFANTYYTGSYTASGSLIFENPISLSQGYDDSVQFALEGEQSQWFGLVQTGNSVTLRLVIPIPPAVIASNQQLVFVVSAGRTGSTTARATIVITLGDEFTGDTILGFERINYQGIIENNEAILEPVILIQGYSPDVMFSLRGGSELESYFTLSPVGATVTISLRTVIPEQSVPPNGVILLELQATAPQALTAYATVVFTIVAEKDAVDPVVDLVFANTYYTGSYTASGSLIFENPISLSQGYDDSVQFALEGEQSQWFGLVQTGNSVTLRLVTPIPPAVIASNQQLVFVVSAGRTGSTTARATIVITLGDEFTGDTILGFERINYQGTIENNEAILEPVTLIQGYSPDVMFSLRGGSELESYFTLSPVGATVTISLRTAIPEQSVPPNGVIVLELQATAPQALTAYATVVFTIAAEKDAVDPVVDLVFANTYYMGSYTASGSLIFENPISLSQGYDDSVQFALEGEQSQWFDLVQTGNVVTLRLVTPVPPAIIASNQQLVFVVSAGRTGSTTARATIVITLGDDVQIGVNVHFENVLYNGIVQNDIVQHESIRVTGFTGADIDIFGEYASLFIAFVLEEMVTVQRSSLDALPNDVEHMALELHAGTGRTVLILRVLHSGVTNQPSVTFSASSYAFRSDVIQTGLLGRVVATADNGEAVAYSLVLDNAHLQHRLSINGEGELYLSAPANSGVYTFEVAATTVFTRATGVAIVYLTVDSLIVCGDDEFVVPPLIILDRDEEEPHRDLVVLDTTQHEGCWYNLTNRWPIDQTWLYVDETGLHATSIDREHESIAFMALSQVQVELILHCDTDNTLRSKRSLEETKLGPYNYGENKWILTNTIHYNSRRSFVNLIVNDINDNAPVFVGKDQEPIAVGYPIPELIDTVLPRALAELQATDADIGENAELLYSSFESVLTVSPTTGFVHVRDGAQIVDGSRLTINATDLNGEGLTGSIDIMVRLLDTRNIVVMLVQDAFLDDEKNITQELSANIGYEIKVLRSTVISAYVESSPDNLRIKRDTSPSGASLQLYVYGLIAREPVTAEQLTTDINNIGVGMVSITSIVSLEDYMEGREICVISGRDTGLLVATIVLSVLLFIILISMAVWYFLKWRKENYDQFSDENSLTSRNESLDKLPNPEATNTPKMRLKIEDLKRSERRLQDMLDAPIEQISVEPSTSKNAKSFDSILDLPLDSNLPIVIQSIDKLKDPEEDSDDDEFGETDKTRRKSVVTFNENVEKIIHVEDDEDSASQPGYEIYKL